MEAEPHAPQSLKAPCDGSMSRVVRENASCRARYRLYEGYRLLFDITSDCASFEQAE